MSDVTLNAVFIAEGSSDMPLADIIEGMFFDRGVTLRLSRPDFGVLGKVPKDVRSRLLASERLTIRELDLAVVHRDADNAGYDARRAEIESALVEVSGRPCLVPVIPIRMTEAWLLLDEEAIRTVAGNPRGKTNLGLPKVNEVEKQSDPKHFLSMALLAAADVTGRRRERVATRFPQHRRQLLERLDRGGPVNQLLSWKKLVDDVDEAVSRLGVG